MNKRIFLELLMYEPDTHQPFIQHMDGWALEIEGLPPMGFYKSSDGALVVTELRTGCRVLATPWQGHGRLHTEFARKKVQEFVARIGVNKFLAGIERQPSLVDTIKQATDGGTHE